MGVPRAEAVKSCEKRIGNLRKVKRPLLFKYFDKIVSESESRIHAVLGQTGSGKSTLALIYLADRYDCDLDEVFARVVWLPDDFLSVYKEGGDVIVWDDAGVWLRLMAKAPWDPLSITFSTIFDVGRLQVPLVILTLVTDRDLPRSLRYNSFIYRSRTRVWRIGYDKEKQAYRSIAVTQFRREKADWSQSYWDANNEYAMKFYHFRRGDSFYEYYLQFRKQYATHFIDFAEENLENSKLYKLIKMKKGGEGR